jgi:hypothetical protein
VILRYASTRWLGEAAELHGLPVHTEVNQPCGTSHQQQEEGEQDGQDADHRQRVLQVMGNVSFQC